MMNWNDTLGQYVRARMIAKALENKPNADIDKLEDSIARTSFTVGIVRESIADVLQAELESVAMRYALGDHEISYDFMAGLVAAEKLVRIGKHVTDDNDSNDNWK